LVINTGTVKLFFPQIMLQLPNAIHMTGIPVRYMVIIIIIIIIIIAVLYQV